MNDLLRRCLDDLEERIDPEQEERLLREWVDFAEGRFTGPLFTPRRDRPSPPGIAWPDVTVNATLVTQRQTDTALEQNEQVKKISGWAAILFGPSLVGAIYGMNFKNMPEIQWEFGYYSVLIVMALMVIGMLTFFRKKKWI